MTWAVVAPLRLRANHRDGHDDAVKAQGARRSDYSCSNEESQLTLFQVLGQAVGDGVLSALLLNLDGALVSCAPPLPAQSDRDAGVIGSNVWFAFDKLGSRLSRGSPVAAPSTSPGIDAPGPAFSVGELGVLLMADGDAGQKIGMARTGGKMVVVLRGSPDVSFAVLKAKVGSKCIDMCCLNRLIGVLSAPGACGLSRSSPESVEPVISLSHIS